MATATEMTLALGRTVYGGDQSGEADSGERIEGRETRLSVTWRLSDEEQDLTLMASVLAEEVERALRQAERALRQADRTVRKGPSPEQSCNIKPVSPPSNEPNPAADTGGVSTEHSRQPASSYSPAGQATPHQNGGKAPTANGSSTGSSTGSSGYPACVPPITKPQQLAIQSHCTRHGVADWELRRLLWEMFGKKEPRELNKGQAGELLTALQREIPSGAAERSTYANETMSN